jgi:protein-tyrosine phosphatase
VLAVWIEDSPDACLKDGVLLGLVRTIVAWLAAGGDAYIHCAAGVSRSSYMDCAVHMAALKVGFDHALAIIRAQRPVADPNAGFVAHLRRLEPQLLAVNP